MKERDIHWAGKVSNYMLELSAQYPERWKTVQSQCMVFGDLSYGSALADWNGNGRPPNAFYSTARGQVPCPYLLEFRKELSAKFGLEILTTEEGEARENALRDAGVHVKNSRVFDWGMPSGFSGWSTATSKNATSGKWNVN